MKLPCALRGITGGLLGGGHGWAAAHASRVGEWRTSRRGCCRVKVAVRRDVLLMATRASWYDAAPTTATARWHRPGPPCCRRRARLAIHWDYEVCVGHLGGAVITQRRDQPAAVQHPSHLASAERAFSEKVWVRGCRGRSRGLVASYLRIRWRRARRVLGLRGLRRSAVQSLPSCAPRAPESFRCARAEPEPYHYRLLLGTPAACRREAGLAALRAWVARQRGTCFTTAGRAWSGGDPPPYARAAGRRVLPEETEADGAAALRVERRGGASGGAALRAVRAARPDAGRRAPRARARPSSRRWPRTDRILRRQPPPPQRPLSPNTPPTPTSPPAATATGRRQIIWDKPVRGLGELPVGFRPPAPPEPPRPASAGRRAAAPPPAVPRPAAEPEWRSRLAIAIVVAAFAVLITILARLDDSDDDGAAADGEHGPWGRVAARGRAAQAIAEQRADLAAARAARRRPPARTPSAAATAAAAAVMVAAAVVVLATAVAGMTAPPAAEARRRS